MLFEKSRLISILSNKDLLNKHKNSPYKRLFYHIMRVSNYFVFFYLIKDCIFTLEKVT